MFKKRSNPHPITANPQPPSGERAAERGSDRITSVIGRDVSIRGQLGGAGGVRIEGSFEGDINIRGLLVVGETGRVTCEKLQANVVVIAGAVRGDILAEKVEIRASGRVWGNLVTTAFSSEEGAFLRGQITMEETVDLEVPPVVEASTLT